MGCDKYQGPMEVHQPASEVIVEVADMESDLGVDAPRHVDHILPHQHIPAVCVPSAASGDGSSCPQKPKPRLKSICMYNLVTVCLD